MTDVFDLPLAKLAHSIASGDISCESIAETLLENYKRNRQSLNAYRSFDAGRVLEDARNIDAVDTSRRAALHGMAVAVKDLYGVPGYPVCAGTPNPLPEVWQQPGPVVHQVLTQNALVSGKTHTVEFAFGGLGVNTHYDTPINPWMRSHIESRAVPAVAQASALHVVPRTLRLAPTRVVPCVFQQVLLAMSV